MPNNKINPNPIIFPKVIQMWNKGPRVYYNWAADFLTRGEAKKLLKLAQTWVEGQENYKGEYLNEE